jgi:hypothetical protein
LTLSALEAVLPLVGVGKVAVIKSTILSPARRGGFAEQVS